MVNKRICIIIAPTNACNLNCDYCYNHYNRSNQKIDMDTVEHIITMAFKEYNEIDFVWRGGEPLLMKRSFYRKVHFLQKKYSYIHGASFRNNIQSNGTLLNRRWIRFLKKHRFGLGISFDGYNNDIHRSKSKETIKALLLCKKMRYSVGCISVITNDNLNLKDLYIYLKSYVSSFKISPCIKTSANDFSVGLESYIKHLKELFDYWISDSDRGAMVHPFDDYIRSEFGVYFDRPCKNAACLGRFLDIDAYGDVRICSHVSDEAFLLGNINKYSSIANVFTGEKFESVVKMMIDRRNVCKNTCKYFGFCQGGCCSEIYSKSNDEMDFSCAVIKTMLDYVSATVRKIILENCDLSTYNPVFAELLKEVICKNPMYFDAIKTKME